MGMISGIIEWFNPPPPESNESVRDKLMDRSSAEIAARLINRARLHEEQGGYASRCSPLDLVAAERIMALEEELIACKDGMSMIRARVACMLEILRRPKESG